MAQSLKEIITQGVINMLQVNLSLQADERVLVITDVPAPHDWQSRPLEKLKEMAERAILARSVAEVASYHFKDVHVKFLPYAATWKNGTEPDPGTAEEMGEADILLAITTYSVSHTDAREKATRAGVRVASMPEFETEMFADGGPMTADYHQIAADCRAFAARLTQARDVHLTCPAGTDLRFSIMGRPGQIDAGLYGSDPRIWGNFPAGEAYVIPVEGTGEGVLVVQAGWFPKLEENMEISFEAGEVEKLAGGGRVGDQLRDQIKIGMADPLFKARRNLAELGIGTNPNARKPDNILEAEKIKGTVHVAIGDNIHMGGAVASDYHEDFVIPYPDVYLDGNPVILKGEWQI